MSAGLGRRPSGPGSLARRLRPLQAGAGLQGFMLWVPVEKLFQTQIGFDAAAIAVMAAAYAAVVPLLEVPSGILADRWSRTGILIISSAAAAASALIGGLSHSVVTYIVAALVLGVYFAMNSGTVDSVVYDTVIEETGSADVYERWIGRVRIVESAAFTASALAGGLLAGATSPRLTYFLTIPFVLASIVAFIRFREPQLHREAAPLALRRVLDRLADTPAIERPHHFAGEPVHDARAAEFHQFDRPRLSGLEAHGRPRGNVQPESPCSDAIEVQRLVRFGKVVMRAHLDRAIAAVRHIDRERAAAGIELDVAVVDEAFTGDHRSRGPHGIG